MKLFLLLLILASVFGAFVLNRQSKAQRSATSPLAIGLAVLALILISVRMLGFNHPEGTERAQVHIASYETAQAIVTGQKIAERHPGSRVTVLIPPKSYGLYRATEHLDELVEALVTEMENNGLQVQTKQIPLPPNPGNHEVQNVIEDEMDPSSEESILAMDMTRYFMEYYTVNRFSQIIVDQTDADAVVCLFDLPMNIDGPELPPKGKGPALVMLYDNVDHLSTALSSTLLDAVVLPQNPHKPWDYEQALPRNPEEGFAKWFYWVTAESADAIKHPSLTE